MGRKSKEQLAAEAALTSDENKIVDTSTQEVEQPKFFERDERGLIKGLKYHFDELGFVSWSKMIPAKYLYIPQDKVERAEKFYKKPVSELNLEEVEDRFLAVLLGGLRYLAQIRGVESIETKVDSVLQHPDYNITTACTHTCKITFIGNYETGGKPYTYSDSASASVKNTGSFLHQYLETCSANRALCRAIRGALNVSLCSDQEISGVKYEFTESEKPKTSGHDPLESLKARCKSNQGTEITFDILKHTCSTKYKEKMVSDSSKWNNWDDIHKNDIFTILHLLNSK